MDPGREKEIVPSGHRERLKSPLENREVRLRGLWPQDRHMQQA
jgi:hypothetical protein